MSGHACKVLVTGATGFVGSALCGRLRAAGHTVIAAVRRGSGSPDEVVIGEMSSFTNWRSVLAGCDAVVHLAARVHVMDDTAQDPLALYRATNTEATLNLARQAAQAGVKRFVFISTIKVNGEGRDAAYRETDVPAPEDAYAISKWEAEQGLQRIAQETGLEVVILRPPLVYGPGVKANFLRLMQTVERAGRCRWGRFATAAACCTWAILSMRSGCVLNTRPPRGRLFCWTMAEPVSTPELIRAVARAMGRPARLLAVPVGVLEFVGRCWVNGRRWRG